MQRGLMILVSTLALHYSVAANAWVAAPARAHAGITRQPIIWVQNSMRPDRNETMRRSEARQSDTAGRRAEISETLRRERETEGRPVRADREARADRPGEAAHEGRGFVSEAALNAHWEDHGTDFGARNRTQYESQARQFLYGPRGEEVLEKKRENGDIIRFNKRTEEFGIAREDGTIRTYFRPDPNINGGRTPLEYYNAQH